MSSHNSRHKCPKCGNKSLVVQRLQDGSTELVCVDPDCDFREIAADSAGAVPGGSFQATLPRRSIDQLREMVENLKKSAQVLSGRAGYLAQRQLAMVNMELKNRNVHLNRPARVEVKDRPKHSARSGTGPGKTPMPPQLNTPQAREKRLNGIRAYHQKRRAQAGGREKGSPSTASMPETLTQGMWFNTLARTLHQEVEMHEQAARNYARTPELFALHIDHSARAFELKRVLDLLKSCFEFG